MKGTYYQLICVSAVSLVAVVVTACGGASTDACVGPGPTGRPTWDVCYDDWDKSDCDNISGDTYASTTCDELGYTKQCPGENGYRRSSYTC